MILLDTHIWIWWVQGDDRLGTAALRAFDSQSPNGLGVSIISCWEVAMLHERNRLTLPAAVDEWIETALAYPGVRLVEMTPAIAIESCRLPNWPNKDPADRIIAATSRAYGCPLVTADRLMLGYPEIRAIHPGKLSEMAG